MKKYFTLLCAALLGMAAYAQDAYDPSAHTVVVAGTPNLCAESWKADGTDVMAYDAASGLWTITLAAKDTKVIEFKIVYDGAWLGKDGGNDNYQFQVTEPSDVTITFDPNTSKATYSGEKVTEYDPNKIDFVVATGSGTLLNGLDWKVELPEAAPNQLTAEEEGYYTLTIKGVAAGSYNFKFAANGSWAKQWGATDGQGALESGKAVAAAGGSNPANFSLVLPKGSTYDVTLTLDIMNPDAPMVTAAWVVAGTAEITEDIYSVAGSMNSWNEKDTETEMTQTAEKVYAYTFKALAAGDYQYKVVVNHDWAVAYGAFHAGQEGDNASFSLTEASDVTITLDLNPETPQLKVTISPSTAIRGLEAAAQSEAVYNLAGQRVSRAVRGIYVINGKKVVR